MVPFSMDTVSEGRNYWFHSAATESGVNILTGSFPTVMGILFSLQNLEKASSIIMVLYLLLKGPA